MAVPPDFGWREGSSQLGSYRAANGGFGWIYAVTGERWIEQSGTLWAWINTAGPYTTVQMVQAYEPSAVNNFPVRAAVRGGDVCSFPSIEADALVAAGIATYA